MQRFHICRVTWPLGVLIAGVIVGPLVRDATARQGVSLQYDQWAAIGGFGLVFAVLVAALWLPGRASWELWLAEQMHARLHPLCFRLVLGSLLATAYLVAAALWAWREQNLMYYTAAALVNATLVLAALAVALGGFLRKKQQRSQ